MAHLEYIDYSPSTVTVEKGAVERTASMRKALHSRLPQIIWLDGRPWREANLWALHRASQREVNIKTVISQFSSLVYYANWLELSNSNWWDFPARKDQRCLIMFRGTLIKERDSGSLSPSTATKRMRDVISFYKWLKATKLLVTYWPMWNEKHATIVINNKYGFERTMTVSTTDLSIKYRPPGGEKLEEGLLPVSSADRDNILRFASEYASTELYLMLTLGFFTGMRIGTLCDLRLETLLMATPDPACHDLLKITIGPGATPKVATKHGVTGQIWITKFHRDSIIEYFYSPRRLLREAKAAPQNKSLIFLTRYGKPYVKSAGANSSAINVEMFNLRNKAAAKKIKYMEGFYFHRSRCTFATELAKILIPTAGAINALAIIKDALLHRDEATTLKYIKFVEKSPAKAAYANEFTQLFLSVQNNQK
ncbi:site-specific integrase [Pseudomonas shirazensis]|uniref:site-specific integrase n=1 Tax=Pseudomonas shirazensis TaxID=2745494 RepID=UPI003D08AC17